MRVRNVEGGWRSVLVIDSRLSRLTITASALSR